MITHQLEAEDGTILRCYTNTNGESIILMQEGDEMSASFNVTAFVFTEREEIDWLIKELNALRMYHFPFKT